MAQGRSCSPALLLLLLLPALADDITSAGCTTTAGTLSRYWLMNCNSTAWGSEPQSVTPHGRLDSPA